MEKSAREIRRQTRRFDEIMGVLDRLVAQWSRLGTEQKKWITGDLKKPREYLSTLIVALKNLYYLHRLTECSEVSTATPTTQRPATSVPGLEARHTAIFCKERQSVLVYEAHRAPSHTNLVRGVICRPEQKPIAPVRPASSCQRLALPLGMVAGAAPTAVSPGKPHSLGR